MATSYKNQGAGYASGTEIDQGAWQDSGSSGSTTTTTTITATTTTISGTTTTITATTTTTTQPYQHLVFVMG